MVNTLRSDELHEIYGVKLEITDAQAEKIIEDPGADDLDALLCVIQAAWATTQPNYGAPEGCGPLEGWIGDPSTT